MTETTIKNLLARQRRISALRFTGENDWLRLALLGMLLITLSAVALAEALATMPLPGHFGGSSALFGGVTIALFIVKLGKGAVYFDWIVFAIACVGVGLVLYADERISEFASLLLISICLGVSSGARLWIGSTASPQPAANWIFASGYVGALGGLWIIGAWLMRMSAPPPIIIALDCLFQGVSITGFGLSLRDTPCS